MKKESQALCFPHTPGWLGCCHIMDINNMAFLASRDEWSKKAARGRVAEHFPPKTGWLAAQNSTTLLRLVFPAHAGMIGASWRFWKDKISISRIRRDDWERHTLSNPAIRYFPHTPGWLVCSDFSIELFVVFPAYAGMIGRNHLCHGYGSRISRMPGWMGCCHIMDINDMVFLASRDNCWDSWDKSIWLSISRIRRDNWYGNRHFYDGDLYSLHDGMIVERDLSQLARLCISRVPGWMKGLYIK